MRLVALTLVLLAGCGAPATQQAEESTLPDPLFARELPDPPADVPADKRIVLPVSECVVEGSEPPQKTPPGIYMTQELATRTGRTKVAYDELRGLYEVDLRTMDREREVYQKQLDMADQEIARLRESARRSWWEQHGSQVMLGVGVALGAVFAIGMAAALDGVTDAVE